MPGKRDAPGWTPEKRAAASARVSARWADPERAFMVRERMVAGILAKKLGEDGAEQLGWAPSAGSLLDFVDLHGPEVADYLKRVTPARPRAKSYSYKSTVLRQAMKARWASPAGREKMLAAIRDSPYARAKAQSDADAAGDFCATDYRGHGYQLAGRALREYEADLRRYCAAQWTARRRALGRRPPGRPVSPLGSKGAGRVPRGFLPVYAGHLEELGLEQAEAFDLFCGSSVASAEFRARYRETRAPYAVRAVREARTKLGQRLGDSGPPDTVHIE
jgi:hypothetical protein